MSVDDNLEELLRLSIELARRQSAAGCPMEVYMGFGVKDSGEREQFASGMQRDVTTGKTDFTLCYDGPMFQRLAEHLTKGAVKYEKRNWMKAAGQAELDRFRESAARHFFQWLRGDTDEDHAAAVLFNINGVEYVKERMCAALKESAGS